MAASFFPQKKADIILFPEGTLSILSPSLIPKPEDNIIPYLNKTYEAYEVRLDI